MCGIAGLIDFTNHAPARDLLERLCARLRHRGPRTPAAGVERLSVTDVGGERDITAHEPAISIGPPRRGSCRVIEMISPSDPHLGVALR